ncbi:MAG: DUF1573 domain-containing protein [Kiritimatiellia bacterium]
MPSDAEGAGPEDASAVIAVVCGKDLASASRYEVRNDALRSVARRRDLPEGDVAELMAYVASGKGSLHPVREAALRNDVLNLLRDQKPVPTGVPTRCGCSLANTGDSPLKVSQVKPCCGAEAELSDMEIAPGASVELAVSLKLQLPGEFSKGMRLYCDDPVAPLSRYPFSDARLKSAIQTLPLASRFPPCSSPDSWMDSTPVRSRS